jgi:flagellar biosynthetic protein FlhB
MAGEKTEKPTQRRLEKARQEGRFPVSREALAGAQMVTFAFLAASYGQTAADRFIAISRGLVEAGFRSEWAPRHIVALLQNVLLPDWTTFLALGAALTASALAVQFLTTGFGLAFSRLAPDLNRLNPGPRLQQFPGERLQQFGRVLLLLPIISWAVWRVSSGQIADLLALGRSGGVRSGVGRTAAAVEAAIWFSAMLLLLAAGIDYLWQRHKHQKSLRMSKQEIRDEHKESEGNPEIKGRIRRLQRDLARRSMMKEVPKATAVIVNPTHFSVAIRYEIDSPGAPKVVAKGKNYLALRIRQRAIEHGVPIVENRPLAQALYKSADVGQEIPPHLYRAVAEVLAYIFKLMNVRSQR